MKVIFQDFDGCLNSSRWIDKKIASGESSFLTREVDPEAVAILNKIIEQTGAKVVISSSWRLFFKLDEIVTILNNAGFKGDVVGVTPRRPMRPNKRGHDIDDWLKFNPVEKYLIIDDDADFLNHQLPYFIQTSHIDGLVEAHLARAVQILGPK